MNIPKIKKVKGKLSGNRFPVSTKPNKVICPAKGKGSYDRRMHKKYIMEQV